jgi:VanZ family protein
MVRLIEWLSERKFVAVILASAYLAGVVFSHKLVSGVFDWIKEKISFKVYNDLSLCISIVFLGGLGMFLLLKLSRGNRRLILILYWVFTIFLVVVSYKMLVVFNVENIHFPQYAILTLPVFALLRHYGATVFWVTLSGVFDEAYQYFVIYHDIYLYLDFNDIVLNLIGAGIGVVWIYTLLDAKSDPFVFSKPSFLKWNKYMVLITMASIMFVGILLYAAGLFRFYSGANTLNTLIVLSRIPASTRFWEIPAYGKPFHICSPLEGMMLSVLLIACYGLMDYTVRAKNR